MPASALLGPLLVVLSGLLYTGGYVVAKLLSPRIDALQITFLRCALLLAGAVVISPLLPSPADRKSVV